jgi:kynurenine 3-monooxygenase
MSLQAERITILGSGLVGSLLAIYLAKRGYQVDIYERRPDMRKNRVAAGRSINLALSERGWTALEQVGIRKQIEDVAIPNSPMVKMDKPFTVCRVVALTAP